MRFLSLRGRQRGRRVGFAKADLAVGVLVTLLLGSCVVMSLPRQRVDGRKAQCRNQLKNVVLATHAYESLMGTLPGKNAATPARLSMFVDLLPYLEHRALHDRLNLQAAEASIVELPDAPDSTYRGKGYPLNPNLPECAPPNPAASTPAGSHWVALTTKMPHYNCPSDLGPGSVLTSGLSYVPVVSTSHPDYSELGSRKADGTLLSALWPASNEGADGRIEDPQSVPEYASRIKAWTIEGIADGSSNTIGFAERIKGKYAGGREMPENMAWQGAAGSGFVVDADGKISADNAERVARCRQSMLDEKQPAMGRNNNALSGVQWFQYTCAWMGCANTLGPPNSAVCSAGDGRAIAESGIAPPSSFHSGGANCGFMDGTVRFVNDAVDLRVFHSLGTIDGGETYSLTN